MTDTEGALAILVKLTPLPGELDEVVEMVRGIFATIRANEPACMHLAAHIEAEGDHIMLYELWTDRASFDLFVQGTDMTEYLARLDTRLSARSASSWIRAAV